MFALTVVFSPFLSTPSARRATVALVHMGFGPPISIHALREEGDAKQSGASAHHGKISIHALREEGDTDDLPF